MEKQNKIMDTVVKAGYKPKADRAILVKYQGENLSEEIINFFVGSFYVLQICEEEILLLPLSNWDIGAKKEVEYRALPKKEITSVTVEEHLLNYHINIHTSDKTFAFTTQQKELSGLRFSGLLSLATESGFSTRNWHSDNLDATLAELKSLGQ